MPYSRASVELTQVVDRTKREPPHHALRCPANASHAASLALLESHGINAPGRTRLSPKVKKHPAIYQARAPTDKAFEALLGQLPDDPAALNRTSIVFATDGEPNDFCQMDAGTFMPPPDVRPRVINAVTQAAARGVETYVINLAADDMLLTQHLEQVAQAGNTHKPPFAPSDQAALAAALADIVEINASCKPSQP